jgi:hypothetical protein
MKAIKSFNDLKDGDKIISPIDNEVTGFRIDKYDGEKYLTGANSAYPIFQFDPNDFYIYDGNKEVGEVDKEYFS